MKQAKLVVISLWFSISFLLLGCNASKETKAEQEVLIENPAPITEPQTDTLKSYLDKQRQGRKNR